MATQVASSRFIDKLPPVVERPVEMQVLCLGLSRTGTTSLVEALQKLGIKSYHFTEAAANQKGTRHVNCWLEAMNAKVQGKGKPFTAAEFDKLLQRYSAVTDAPCINFADELVAAYPNARVILTTRDPQPWLKSMEVSYYYILGWKIWPFARWLDPLGLGALYSLLRVILQDWTSNDWSNRDALLSGAAAHNAHIRAIVPADNLLEFRVQEGWTPLCKFLGKEIPDVPFPRANVGKDSASRLKLIVVARTAIILGQAAKKWVIPAAVVVGGLWWMSQ